MNPNAVFVDSDAWIPLLSQSDVYHRQSRQLLRQLMERDCALITSSAVVLEVGDGLATRGLREFAWLFRDLLNAPKVEVVMIDGT